MIAFLRAVALTGALAAALPINASAWGAAGHIIVAAIAEQYLDPAAAQHVRELLALQNAVIRSAEGAQAGREGEPGRLPATP